MFASEEQRNRVCIKLASSLRSRQTWWTLDGPTNDARRVMAGAGSTSEVLLACLCFDVWNGRGKLDFGRMLHVFDATRLELVAGLLLALANGTGAVEHWLGGA